MGRILIAVTGASGAAHAVDFVKRCPGEKYLVMSDWARQVLQTETGLKPSDLAVMTALQRDLLKHAAKIVAPGGLLVYSTCSLETEENDEQVERFLGEHREWRLEPPPDGTVPAAVLDAGRLRVLPHRHGTDGAFAARLRRMA